MSANRKRSRIDSTLSQDILYQDSTSFDSFGGGDSVEVIVVAAVVAVIVILAGISTIWRYRSCWPEPPM